MKNRPILIDAIRALREDASVSTRGNEIIWNDGNPTNITREQIDTKLVEMQSEYDLSLPLGLLREERNHRIAKTDWRFRSDLSPSQEWKDYCKALRDFPANYSPTFDIVTEDNYPLVKEDATTPWPEEPTDG